MSFEYLEIASIFKTQDILIACHRNTNLSQKNIKPYLVRLRRSVVALEK